MRLIHFADNHLDRPFVGLDREAARASRSRLFETFTRCVAAAREHGADAITIGGDLWEEEHVSADTRSSVAHVLGNAGVPVLIATGNHDPLRRGGEYERTRLLERENVHIFPPGELGEQRLDERVSVWGASWGESGLTASVIDRGDALDPERTNLLLLHGAAMGLGLGPDESEHCPFDPARVRERGFAACLAGHVHMRTWDQGVLYPGSPEPLRWRETGPSHGYAVVDVDETGAIEVELVDAAAHRYEQVDVSVGACSSTSQLSDALDREAPAEDASLHLRLTVRGTIPRGIGLDRRGLAERLARRYAELDLQLEVHPERDLDELRQSDSLTGEVVRRLDERIEQASDGKEARRLERAREAALGALDGIEEPLDVS